MAARPPPTTTQSVLVLLCEGGLPADVADAVIALVLVQPAAVRSKSMHLVAKIIVLHYMAKSSRTATSEAFKWLVKRHGRAIALWLFLVACGVPQVAATQEITPEVVGRELTKAQARAILEHPTRTLAPDSTVFSATQRTTFTEAPAEVIANAYARAEQLAQQPTASSTPSTPSFSSAPSSVATPSSAPSFPPVITTYQATVGPSSGPSSADPNASSFVPASPPASTAPANPLVRGLVTPPIQPAPTMALARVAGSTVSPSALSTVAALPTFTSRGSVTPASITPSEEPPSLLSSLRHVSSPPPQPSSKRPRVDPPTPSLEPPAATPGHNYGQILERFVEETMQNQRKELERDIEGRFKDREKLLDNREARLQRSEQNLRNREFELLRDVSERERAVAEKEKALDERAAMLDQRNPQLKNDKEDVPNSEAMVDSLLARMASDIATAQALRVRNATDRTNDHLGAGGPTPTLSPLGNNLALSLQDGSLEQPQDSQGGLGSLYDHHEPWGG